MKKKKSNSSNKFDRRKFVKSSVYTGVALAAFPAILTHSSNVLAESFGDKRKALK